MSETRSAKKRKNDGGSDDDGLGENLGSSVGGSKSGSDLNRGGEPSDIVQTVVAMQKEMEKMRRQMAEMEKGMTDLKENNKILEKRLSYTEDENKKLLEVESKIDDLDKRMKKKKNRYVADARCDRIEKSLAYHRYLVKNQQWENPAPTVPSSYWASNGYDEETAADLKSLVKKIRDRTKYMKVDGEKGIISVNRGNDERVIPYDDVLLPQWKEFTHALRQYRHFIDQCPETVHPWLSISNAQLPRQILDRIEWALTNTHFKKISLAFNDAGRDMASFLSKIAKSNPKLKILINVGNPIQDEQDFAALVDTISTHPSLRVLNLAGSCRELSYDTITSLFSSTHQLQNILLPHNGISTLGNTFLELYFEENVILKALHLKDNNLDDFDAKSIARGLGKNDTLVLLDVSNNNITGDGKDALLRAVFDSTTLHSAARSNHSCHIQCDDERLETINRTPEVKKSNRRQKLYSILSSRNKESNNVVQLGENITKKHIPAVLDAAQKYSEVEYGNENGSEVVPPLSIVYEILRGWSMPVLYEDV